jgi:hypothetical protein
MVAAAVRKDRKVTQAQPVRLAHKACRVLLAWMEQMALMVNRDLLV